MPYKIEKSDQCPMSKPWALIKKDDGKLIGCHKTEDSAKQQMAAVYANENKKTKEVAAEEKTHKVSEVAKKYFDE